jgi:tetratricopeptide (TPR) repeat protein
MAQSEEQKGQETFNKERSDLLREDLETWYRQLIRKLEAAERAEDWPKVEGLCKQILQRDGDNWAIWQRLALSLEARSDWTQAEILWRHLTQRFNQRPEPYLALASLQRKRGAPDSARLVLEQAERQLGQTPELAASLGVIDDPWADISAVVELSRDAPATAVAMALQKAQSHLDAGRWIEAEASFEQLLIARPQSISFHLSLAQLRLRRGEIDQLLAQLAPLYQPCPDQGALVEKLELPLIFAEALRQLERWSELSELLRVLQQLHPMDARLPYRLAQAAMAQDRDLEAVPLLQRSLALQPNFAQAEMALGQLHIRLGDWPAAIDALTRAVALNPRLDDAAMQLELARREQLWSLGEQALAKAEWLSATQAYRQLLDRSASEKRALERLELLASLEADQLASSAGLVQIETLQGEELRLAEFSAALDRLEARLDPLL